MPKKNNDLINVEHEETLEQAEAERQERAKRREDAQPKKQPKTIPIEEKEGQAVATFDVPAHTAEVPVAKSKIDGVLAATVEAWHSVKGNGDAEFALCVSEFRQNLVNHAEEVFLKNVVTDDDTVMARFEREVAKIKLREEEKAKAA